MRLLLDTQLLLLLWALVDSSRLRRDARAMIETLANTPVVSVASVWEIAFTRVLGRQDFTAEPSIVRRTLRDAGDEELAINGEHTLHEGTLPDLHRDPFDRMLIAQAHVDGPLLLTTDAAVARYPGPIHLT
jgi:PIN domain nuclease of toxin-antitoxin system